MFEFITKIRPMHSFKTFLLASLSIFTVTLLNSQAVIDAGLIPADGDKWEVEFVDAANFQPGAAGANLSWDFSGIDRSQAQTLTFEIVPLMDAVGSNLFPNADFCWHLQGFNFYNYYQANTDSMSLLGVVAAGSGQEINFLTTFSRPEDVIRFPLSFQDSYGYTSAFTSGIPGSITFEGQRTGTVEVDGYGTIITPFGTYTNVLRIKIVEQDNLSNAVETQYAWLQADNFTPLMVYNTSTDPEEMPSLYYARPVVVSDIRALQTSTDLDVKILGNPSKHMLNISIDSEEILRAFQVQLITTDGKVIHTDTHPSPYAKKQQIAIPVQNLPSGLYFVRIVHANKSTQKTWIKR